MPTSPCHFLFLAAGSGRRFAGAGLKMLTPTETGRPLLVQTILNVREVFPQAHLHVVIGTKHEALPLAIQQHVGGVRFIRNRSGEESPVSSLAAAVEVFGQPGAVCILNGDTLFAAAVFQRLEGTTGNALMVSSPDGFGPDDLMVEVNEAGDRMLRFLGKGHEVGPVPGRRLAVSSGCFFVGDEPSRELLAEVVLQKPFRPRWHLCLNVLRAAGRTITPVRVERSAWHEVDTAGDAAALQNKKAWVS